MMHIDSRVIWRALLCLLVLNDGGIPPLAAPAAEGTEARLSALKSRAMSADYGADLDELARVRDAALALAGDPHTGYLASYWAGFASWRIAINGNSKGLSRDELVENLRRALADFEASTRSSEGFADGHAAAAGAASWMAGMMAASDPIGARETWALSASHLERARTLEPENPRVLWVEAARYVFSPFRDVERGIEIYRKMLAAAETAGASGSPQPDWGAPEALMSLAWAHVNQPRPDLEAALHEARAALRLVPGWFYVKEILLPQIEAARAAGTTSTDPLVPLAYLVGGTWTARGEVPGLGAFTAERTYQWALDGRFIEQHNVMRFDQGTLEAHGVLGWDPGEQSITSWLFGSDGSFTTSRADRVAGDEVRFEGVRVGGFGGGPRRGTYRKVSDGEFVEVAESKAGEDWTPVSTYRFVRVKVHDARDTVR